MIPRLQLLCTCRHMRRMRDSPRTMPAPHSDGPKARSRFAWVATTLQTSHPRVAGGHRRGGKNGFDETTLLPLHNYSRRITGIDSEYVLPCKATDDPGPLCTLISSLNISVRLGAMTWRMRRLRAAPARIPRPGCDIVLQARKSVEMSLDAADECPRHVGRRCVRYAP
jgi:hypothetical protein